MGSGARCNCSAHAPAQRLERFLFTAAAHKVAHADAVDGLLAKPGIVRKVAGEAAHNPLQHVQGRAAPFYGESSTQW